MRGLIAYLQTLPQDATIEVADGESYRHDEDDPDWDEEGNISFPLEAVETHFFEGGPPVVTFVGER